MKNIKALIVGATYFSIIFGIAGFILNIGNHVINIR
ncbi:hypothetical protein SAMN02194393_00707 [Maledivibacter halophilus]|uniref:Uncharacterized protein n=1 Tax=Maledivibacter halophilus TaxID=36842 RepID=A0A1T5ISR2_9FIRM|nr:hypothetical protein SAMN02194393_00707 [Maledivibacter halophilus]